MTVIPNAVRGEALQEAIQERIKQLILTQQLGAGAPLPPEGELARAFGVSRNAVREAIKVLQTLGIVETRHGQGTFVGDLSLTALVEGLSFRVRADVGQELRTLLDLVEVREALESALVARVATVISEAELAPLRTLVASMQEHQASDDLFTADDRAFHEALYLPLHNQLMVQLLRAFWDVFHLTRSALLGTPTAMTTTIEAHRQIVEALEHHDAPAAAQAMEAHFEGIKTRALESQKLRHSTAD